MTKVGKEGLRSKLLTESKAEFIKQESPLPSKWQERNYLSLAVVSGVFFGIAIFLVGLVSSKGAQTHTLMPYAIGWTVFWLFYHLGVGYRNKTSHGSFYSKSAYLIEGP